MKAHRRLFLIICSSFVFIGFGKAQGQWVWVYGDTTGQAPSYGIKGVPSPNNFPAGRYESSEWTDNKQGKFWSYGGCGIWGYRGDLWMYDPANNMWTWIHGDSTMGPSAIYGIQGVPAPGNTPGARGTTSATWVDTYSNLWLFGGTSVFGKYNDLWKYDLSLNEWTWMHGSKLAGQSGIYGTKGVPDPANTPGARHETSCSWADQNNNLWLFGGTGIDATGSSEELNDLWKYNIATNEWTWVSGDNMGNQADVYGTKGVAAPINKPGRRGGIYTNWIDSQGNLWMFSGYSNSGIDKKNDLWKYNPVTNEWTWVSGSNLNSQAGNYGTKCIPSVNNEPSARFENREEWIDDCDNLWLFGGFSNSGVKLNDLWKYNTATNEWTWVSGDNTGNQSDIYGTQGVPSLANKPGGKMGGLAWKDSSGFWIYGGVAVKSANIMWKYIPNAPSASFVYSDSLVCSDLAIINFTHTSLSNCGVDIKSYSWDFGDPSSGANNTSDIQHPSHQYNNEGTYNVRLEITSCLGKKDSVTKTVTVNFQSIVSLGNDTTLCPDANLTLDAGNSGSTYQWSTGEITQSIVVVDSNFYWVEVFSAACSESDTILVSKLKQIDLGEDISLCDVFPNTLILDAGYNAQASYLWSTGETTSSIEVTEPGTVWVEKQISNCILVDTTEVTGNMGSSGLYLPNSFTPNTDDGLNEVFTAYGEEVTYFQMQIFNRWGELLYQTEDINKGWDGKYKDELVSIGIYLWTVDYKLGCTGEEVLHKTGHVLLK